MDETRADHNMDSGGSSRTPTERERMRRIAEARDNDAFDALSDTYRESLRRFLLAQMDGDSSAAEDLLQETLLRLWTRAGTWDGRGGVKAWLFRIAGNLASNHRRTIARRRERAVPAMDDASGTDGEDIGAVVPAALRESAAEGPDVLTVRAAERDRVRRLLQELPEDSRELLRLVHEEERDLRDVAATLGVPEGTVKSRLHYTRKRLARAWDEDRHDA